MITCLRILGPIQDQFYKSRFPFNHDNKNHWRPGAFNSFGEKCVLVRLIDQHKF